jgi:hypothetical protein
MMTSPLWLSQTSSGRKRPDCSKAVR